MPISIQPVTYDAGTTSEDLKILVRRADSRAGKILDIFATELTDAEGETRKVTISEHNLDFRPDERVRLVVIGEDEMPTEGDLEVAGTAYVEGSKKIVAIYR